MEPLVISTSEAAKALSTSRAVTLDLIERGEIMAYREGRNWKIPVAGLAQYVVDRAVKETEIRRKKHENH